MSDIRFEKIETKIAFLEDSVQELSNTVYAQQQEIDRLRALCESLTGYVRDLVQSSGEGPAGNERPPHY